MTLTGFSTNYKLCFPLLALQCISQWSSGYLPKMLFTKKHNYKTETRTQPCLRPIVARTSPTIQTPEFNHVAIQPRNFRHLEWLYGGSGNELDGQTDCMIRTLCRTTSRSLSAQRQSYLGETIDQMDQHEHCPWCLQGNQTWFQQAPC